MGTKKYSCRNIHFNGNLKKKSGCICNNKKECIQAIAKILHLIDKNVQQKGFKHWNHLAPLCIGQVQRLPCS